jgi:hypothetical protein
MKQLYFLLLAILLASCNSNENGIAATDSSYKTVVPQTPFVNAENYT